MTLLASGTTTCHAMFTGLVEARGEIVRIQRGGRDASVTVRAPLGGGPLVLGESIAVDGACLTVASIVEPGPGAVAFQADVSSETLARTTLGDRASGDRVNLERALAVGSRLGGHMVSGHVDAVGVVVSTTKAGAGVRITIEVPLELGPLIATKGSICVSGVSLTVNRASPPSAARVDFDVLVVPHTQAVTSLAELGPGCRVNIEVDVVARYLARLAGFQPSLTPSSPTDSSDEAWTARLTDAGYM